MDYGGESDPVPVSIAIGDFSGHCFCMPSRAASPVDKAIFYYFQGSYEHFSLNSVFHIPFDTILNVPLFGNPRARKVHAFLRCLVAGCLSLLFQFNTYIFLCQFMSHLCDTPRLLPLGKGGRKYYRDQCVSYETYRSLDILL